VHNACPIFEIGDEEVNAGIAQVEHDPVIVHLPMHRRTHVHLLDLAFTIL
jgi:hypothetical protein